MNNMHKYMVFGAYGWLVLTGVLHFVIDVLSQYIRGRRAPGVEATLYYGLNSAFSLGKVAFGLLGLFLAWRAMSILSEMPVLILSAGAALGWLAIAFFFIEYWQPKFNAGIFFLLIVAAILTRRSGGN
jgi:hypothetical protein